MLVLIFATGVNFQFSNNKKQNLFALMRCIKWS